jgi:hypothetical protein
MATKSFTERLEIQSDESASAFLKAADEARNHEPIERKNVLRDRESGLRSLRERYSR